MCRGADRATAAYGGERETLKAGTGRADRINPAETWQNRAICVCPQTETLGRAKTVQPTAEFQPDEVIEVAENPRFSSNPGCLSCHQLAPLEPAPCTAWNIPAGPSVTADLLAVPSKFPAQIASCDAHGEFPPVKGTPVQAVMGPGLVPGELPPLENRQVSVEPNSDPALPIIQSKETGWAFAQ